MFYFNTIKGYLNELYTQLMINKEVYVTAYDKRHKEIHEGDMYSFSGTVTINAGASYKIYGLTPSDKYIHMIPPQVTIIGEDVDVIGYRNMTGYSGGTSITPLNNDGNSSNTSAWQSFVIDATITDHGDAIWTSLCAGGSKQGGTNIAVLERILKQNTIHGVVITNNDAQPAKVNIFLEWYETTNIND